jgi:hypothetical protein
VHEAGETSAHDPAEVYVDGEPNTFNCTQSEIACGRITHFVLSN